MKSILHYTLILLMFESCQPAQKKEPVKIRLITLDPGHFHAALVQKNMYPEIDSTVNVYAPLGADLEEHLKKISNYNTRSVSPTHWNEQVYTGTDFFTRMLTEKKGNVVVIAGNNRRKTEYIEKSIQNGFNVLADKPMAIDYHNFKLLEKSFAEAAERKLLLYDIMTERYEIATAIQRELAMFPVIFGTLKPGNTDKPGVEMESVHFFYKRVSDNVLTRPAWFMDVTQQGESMVDVATHLVDLVQWECFPDQIIDYKRDVQILNASHEATEMNLKQFDNITQLNKFPGFLKKDVVSDTLLRIYTNGQINYLLKGIQVRVTAKWAFKAPEGSGDTHYSILRGTLANLEIRQGKKQDFKPVLYLEPVYKNSHQYADSLVSQFKKIQARYPGVELQREGEKWKVNIPEKYYDGHEAHFAKVTEKFIGYLMHKNMPAWEVPNMIAKYYTTTKALSMVK